MMDDVGTKGHVTTTVVPTTGTAPASWSGSLYPSLEGLPGQTHFSPPLMSAHDEIEIARPEAVRQARQVERQSEHARGGITRKTNMVVGADLRPQMTPNWRALGQTLDWAEEWAAQAEGLLNAWMLDRRKLCDAEGHYNFGGMMWLAYRNLIGPDGETAGVIHYDMERARAYGTQWGTFVTVLDPQRIMTPPRFAGDANVVEGRRLDRYGRTVGFYVHNYRPGQETFTDDDFEYVPRETSFGRPMHWHWFQKHRGAAQRGITALVNTLKRTRMLDQYDSAVLGAAIVQAAMATYVKTQGSAETARENLAPAASSVPDQFGAKLGFYEKTKLRIGPQRIPVLPQGDEIKIEAAARQATDPAAFRKGYMRELASALNMTGEQLSLDYSDVNYSSARAALIDIWRGVLVERSMFCHAVPSLIVDALIEEAVVKGWLLLPAGAPSFYEAREAYTRCTWTGPGMGWVDPKKEAEAAQIRTNPQAPLSTLADEAQAQGKSIDEIIETRAREQRKLEAAGLGGSHPTPDPDPEPAPQPERREDPEE